MFTTLLGKKGDKGDKGDTGDTGEQGVKGDKGDKGDTGEQGAAAYTDRGDPSSYDYEIGDLEKDGLWHELDLHEIVGTGKRLVLIEVRTVSGFAEKVCLLKTNGNTNDFNRASLYTQVEGNPVEANMWVCTDSDGKIEYKFDNTTWNVVMFIVRGWFAC